MTDRYEKIRKALKMGPTPGPWTVRYDYVVQATSFDGGRLVPVAQPYGVNSDGTDLFANARMIAACDPDTIRELLKERDQLAAENARLREALRELEGREQRDEALLRQALEALEVSTRFVYADMRPQCEDAIAALRARLGEKE